MLLTNQTTADYFFGPLHLPGGVGQTLTVDDTSATSLYLTDDSVADAINALYAAGKVTVSGAAPPFPRPTGEADVLHGDGSPEGLVFAAQGSLYLRRDKMYLYQKSSGVRFSTGWIQLNVSVPVAPAVALYETYSRLAAGGGLSVLASGTLLFQAIFLPANTVISGLTFVSGGTAAGTPLNQWFALYDQSLNKLAVTGDDTTAAWPADTAKTLAFATPFTTTYSGLHYLGVMVKATTVPTLAGQTARASVTGLTPKTCGSSSTGLASPASAPTTAAGITAVGASIYAYVS